MRPLQRGLAVLGVVALVTGAALVPVVASSDFAEAPAAQIVFLVLAGYGFVGTGLIAWTRRPESRIGAIMVFTGFAWFASYLSNSNVSLLFTAGLVVSNVFAAGVIHLLLAFPSGHLRDRFDRALVTVSYVTTSIGLVPALLVHAPGLEDDCARCPSNALLIGEQHTVFDIYSVALNVWGVVLLSTVLVTLVRRYRTVPATERRVLAPVYLSGGFMLCALTLALAFGVTKLADTVGLAIYLVAVGSFALLPYLFLGALVRTRMLTAGRMTRLLDSLGHQPARGALRDALAGALGDDTLALTYWLPAQGYWVDARGNRVDAPQPGLGRAVHPVVHNGERVAAIDFDASVVADDDMVSAIGGAVALAMENERLDAELRARLEELHTSRARLVEAGISERRRLERDLHDGAQQRLVSLALNLRMAQGKLEDDPAGASTLLTSAARELELALEELRELARGIHPAVLSDRGLDAALAGLAARAPLPVDVHSKVDGDVPEAIESAAYFVVSEALTNIAKYANAATASVQLEHSHGFVSVAVRDDGVGGADPSSGSGLRGLGDRVSALDGRLEIDSREGRGTTIRARFPCG